MDGKKISRETLIGTNTFEIFLDHNHTHQIRSTPVKHALIWNYIARKKQQSYLSDLFP
jgi:hypothetical protein